jgi:hypothetical protein
VRYGATERERSGPAPGHLRPSAWGVPEPPQRVRLDRGCHPGRQLRIDVGDQGELRSDRVPAFEARTTALGGVTEMLLLGDPLRASGA